MENLADLKKWFLDKTTRNKRLEYQERLYAFHGGNILTPDTIPTFTIPSTTRNMSPDDDALMAAPNAISKKVTSKETVEDLHLESLVKKIRLLRIAPQMGLHKQKFPSQYSSESSESDSLPGWRNSSPEKYILTQSKFQTRKRPSCPAMAIKSLGRRSNTVQPLPCLRSLRD